MLVKRLLLLCLAAFVAGCGSPGARQPDGELEKLALAAASGDRIAQYDLAVAYYVGREAPQDYAKAAALWRPLAETDFPEACNNLGYLTYYGLGVPEDPAAGIRLWRKAVRLGVSESSYHLGFAALDGKELPRDPVEAFARLRAAVLMPGSAPDADEREIIELATAKLREVSPSLSPSERARGESMARAYAAESVRPPRAPE